MNRKLVKIGVVLAVLLLGLGGAFLLWPQDRITAVSWEKIRIGMTEKEVETILGGPGIDEHEFWLQYEALKEKCGKEPFVWDGHDLGGHPVSDIDDPEVKFWLGYRGQIRIQFNNEGNVRWKQFQGGRSANPNILDRLRDWLGW
jgi:hypothetical protein